MTEIKNITGIGVLEGITGSVIIGQITLCVESLTWFNISDVNDSKIAQGSESQAKNA